jgi:diguanylate cyclase (GGDEF)-like protein
MNDYERLLSDYQKLKDEFEVYQDFAESIIQRLSESLTKSEKKLDSITNIVEVSKYINSNLSEDNLISMINDMIIGILGVKYSSIYLLKEDCADEFIIKATNSINSDSDVLKEHILSSRLDGKVFVINDNDPLFENFPGREDIHSIIGVPIYLREEFKGYIIVEHSLCDFFSQEHSSFISSIANQIGIALENNFLYNRIKESSIRDPLLGIFNRRYFFELIESKVKEAPENNFAIVMIDIDKFKKVNDTFGHQFGDKTLIEVSKIIAQSVGENDYVARYGGEEIVIYLGEVNNPVGVFEKIDKLRSDISETVIELDDIQHSVTASFGISFYPKDGGNVQDVLSVADLMLYDAKHTGRNRVVSSWV